MICLLDLGGACTAVDGEDKFCISTTVCAAIGDGHKMCVNAVANCIEFDANTKRCKLCTDGHSLQGTDCAKNAMSDSITIGVIVGVILVVGIAAIIILYVLY